MYQHLNSKTVPEGLSETIIYEGTFHLHNPMTEEEWDCIDDVDFDRTERILFSTKHGKEVEFVKEKSAHWIGESDGYADGEPVCDAWYCSACDYLYDGDEKPDWNYCPNCGAKMENSK